jgi:hypothetical protein
LGWASNYIKELKNGNTVEFRPRGNSMKGKIESGELCTIVPIINYDDLKSGDIVLCKVKSNEYLHLIKSIKGNQFKISNNKGYINGTISGNSIFGKCIKIEK